MITGASGFVGSTLIRQATNVGRRVHAFVRSTSPRAHLEQFEPTWHVGDVTDPKSLERAFQAVAGTGEFDVVHCAALISYRTQDAIAARVVNVEGTRHVLEAAKRAGARRVCHVSSVVSVAVAEGTETLDESVPFRGLPCSHYTTTKRAAEDYVRAIANEQEVVIVCPGAIFGASATMTNSMLFLERAAAGRLPAFAPPGMLSVVGVEDVARGILLALERGRAGERYLLTGENLTHAELFGLAAELSGQRGPRGRLAPWLWRLAAIGVGLVDRVRPLELVTPQMMAHLGATYRFDAAKAQRELGLEFEPARTVLKTALACLSERN